MANPTLRVGSRGEDVKRIQKIVGAKVDGVFGPETARLVEAWKKKNGLPADGVWGPKAWAKAGTSGAGGKKNPDQVKSGRPANPKPKSPEKVQGYGFVEEFLNQYPELKSMVAKAVKEEWTPDRFETALRGSKWYQRRNEAQRQWDILVGNQPKEAAQRKAEVEKSVRDMAQQMGVTLTDTQVQTIAQNSYRGGDVEALTRAKIADQGALGEPPASEDLAGANEGQPGGQAGLTQDQLKRLAQDYGVPVGGQRMNEMIRDVLAGRQTVDQFTSYFQNMAKSMFPDLVEQLDAGYSTKQVLDPYIQMTAGTLEIDSDMIDLTDPRWLPQKDGGGLMTLNEWQKQIRTDKSYGYQNTRGGQDEAWKMADRIGKLFGSA